MAVSSRLIRNWRAKGLRLCRTALLGPLSPTSPPLAAVLRVPALGRLLPRAVIGCLDPTQNRHPAGLGEWLKLHLKPTFRPFRGADSETCAAMRSTSSRTASMILAWRNARPSAATPASIVSAVCLTVFRLFASLGKSGRRRESWIH